MWAGIAGATVNGGKVFEVAISIHDSVYNTDFSSTTVPFTSNDPAKNASVIENHVIDTINKFSQEHLCKFLGAGVTLSLLKEVRLSPVAIAHRLIFFSAPICAPGSGETSTSCPLSSTSNLSILTPSRVPMSSIASLLQLAHMFHLELTHPPYT